MGEQNHRDILNERFPLSAPVSNGEEDRRNMTRVAFLISASRPINGWRDYIEINGWTVLPNGPRDRGR